MALEMELVTYFWAGGAESIVETVDLGTVVTYLPRTPPREDVWTPGLTPGSWPLQHRVENAVETVVARAAAPETAHSLYLKVKQVVERARLWGELRLKDRRVMVRVRDTDRHATGVWFEARLWGGDVQVTRGTKVELIMVRAPYWDAAEETLQIANVSTSNVMADTAVVQNREDSVGCMRVKVDHFAGDAPAPATIVMENVSSTYDIYNVRIGWAPRWEVVAFEAERSANPVTPTYGAQHSNGATARVTYPTAYKWVSSVAQGPYRIFGLGDLRSLSWGYAINYFTVLGINTTITGVWGWTDLGTAIVPPGGYVRPGTSFDIYLKHSNAVGGDLDYLLLMPLWQYRKLQVTPTAVANGETLTDDGWRQEAFYEDAAGNIMPVVDAWGPQIYLWPEKLLLNSTYQMLVFMQGRQNIGVGGADAYADMEMEVALKVRPRYAGLP